MNTLFVACGRCCAHFVKLVLGITLLANAAYAQELQYTWKVTTPFTGVVRDSQAQAEADLHSYTGGTTFTDWHMLTKRSIKNQSAWVTTNVYEAPPVPIQLSSWNYSYNLNGQWAYGTSEQEMLNALWPVVENMSDDHCAAPQLTNPGEWAIAEYWFSSDVVIRERKTVTYRTYKDANCFMRTPSGTMERLRTVICPAKYTGSPSMKKCVVFNTGTITQNVASYCSAEDGNPCDAATGAKSESKTDYQSNTLAFTRGYSSIAGVSGPQLGNHWHHNHSRRVIFSPLNPSALINAAGHQELLYSAGGSIWRSYYSGKKVYASGNFWIVEDANANKEYYLHTPQADNNSGHYGILIKIVNAQGQETLYDYYEGTELLETVTDHFGRTLSFTYNSDGNIATMTDPAGGVYSYLYDANKNLEFVVYPDNTPGSSTDNPRIQYHYEDTGFPYHLTGITDESGQRYATYDYDTRGRVVLSEHTGAERTELVYNTNGSTTVTEKINGTTNAVRTYNFSTINGERKVTSVTGDVCSSCGNTSKSKTYDTSGNPDLVTDWNNVVTDYNYDTARSLET